MDLLLPIGADLHHHVVRDWCYGLWFWVEGNPVRLGNLSALSFLSRSFVTQAFLERLNV